MNLEKMAMGMLQSNNKNPMLFSIAQMVQKKDGKGIEQFARNMCREKGLNPDEEIAKLKRQFGV